MWFDLYQLLPRCAGTDGYHCSQDAEDRVRDIVKHLSDADIRSAFNKFRHENGREAEYSFADKDLQIRIDEILCRPSDPMYIGVDGASGPDRTSVIAIPSSGDTALDQQELDRFARNDAEIQAGRCPNGHGEMFKPSASRSECFECGFVHTTTVIAMEASDNVIEAELEV